MPRSSKKTVAQATTLSAFEERVREALRHVRNDDALAASPLAEPYFLGASPTGDTYVQPHKLVGELRAAALDLWGTPSPGNSDEVLQALRQPSDRQQFREGRYHFGLLDLNYFHVFLPDDLRLRYGDDVPQSAIYNEVLHISRASHDRHLQAAIRALSNQFLARTRPTLRAEPAPVPGAFIGRGDVVESAIAALTRNERVVVSGPAGVGKTSLGAAIAATWPCRPAFWLTFRPSLNVSFNAAVMALGNFAQQHAPSALWGQLVADGGWVRDAQLAAALLRDDLARWRAHGRTPLLCFDELDALREGDGGDTSVEGQRILALLESLRGSAPTLLIGQHTLVNGDVQYELGNFEPGQTAAMLAHMGIAADATQAKRIHDYTRGNPRLLSLCRAFAHAQADAADMLDQLPNTPDGRTILKRLWDKLTADQQRVLQLLSVFRSAAPRALFHQADVHVRALKAQGLVTHTALDTLDMLPALQHFVYDHTTVEEREQMHGIAAGAHAERGDFVAAARHYALAARHARAASVLLPHLEAEIQRGQAAAALRVLQSIPTTHLPKRLAGELALARARLLNLVGEPAQALNILQQTEARGAVPQRVDWLMELARAHERTGNPEHALRAYRESESTLRTLLRKRSLLVARQAQLLTRKREMEAALAGARRAHFEAERVQGVVLDEMGQPDAARAHFQAALTLAETLNDALAVAHACNSLAIIAARQGDPPVAGPYFERARRGFEETGDVLEAAQVQSNVAGMYVAAGDYASAVAPGEQALAFFEHMNHAQMIASTGASLAEAMVNLGRLDEARRYAEMVIGQEEPQFVPYGLYTLGDVARAEGDEPTALQYYEHSLKLADENHDPFMRAYAHRRVGEQLCALGRLSDGDAHLTQATVLFEALGMPHEVERTRRCGNSAPADDHT